MQRERCFQCFKGEIGSKYTFAPGNFRKSNVSNEHENSSRSSFVSIRDELIWDRAKASQTTDVGQRVGDTAFSGPKMADALLPAEVLRNVDAVDSALQQVEDQMGAVLPQCKREALEKLSSVERASLFLTLSQTANALFCLYLKTNGLSPDGHPAKGELERVELYKDKVQRAVNKRTGPTRPTSSLDIRAANRFIEHSIPDLSQEQKKRVREIGKQAVANRQSQGGTTSTSPEKKPKVSGLSLADEVTAFLAEASKEIIQQTAEEPSDSEE